MIGIRTGFSFRQAVGDIPAILDARKEAGAGFASVTDRDNAFAWGRWFRESEKRNLKPVLGVQLAVSPDVNAKKPIYDYWTFLPLPGCLASLNEIITLATGQFRYRPLLSYRQAVSNPNVIKILGYRTVLNSPEFLEALRDNPIYLYAGLSPSVSRNYFDTIESLQIPWVYACDNRYPAKENLAQYEVTCGRNSEIQNYIQHIPNIEEYSFELERVMSHIHFKRIKAIKKHARELTKSLLLIASDARPDKSILPAPERPKGGLKGLCLAGARKRLQGPITGEYRARLKKELGLISKKGFEDYFLIVSNVVNWAKERMLVGPARGSAGGSLVCYLMGITDVDPIQHGLIFERFISPTRKDLPDIDVDFPEHKRESVIDYLKRKYNHVARIGTIAYYRPKSAIREACGALQVPLYRTEKTMSLLPKRAKGDARFDHGLEDAFSGKTTEGYGKALIEKHPELAVAADMEGQPRHASQHASAVIISSTPLTDIAPLDLRNNVLQIDMKDCEHLGLLKFDCLGLTQLSIIEETIIQAGMPISASQLPGLSLENKDAFEVANTGKLSGIFQFNGQAVQKLVKQTYVESFSDLVAIISLARPGPMKSGTDTAWIQRKAGLEDIVYLSEAFKPILEETQGLIIYQEQIMEICKVIGGFDWAEVASVRKNISKSMGSEILGKFRKKFVRNAHKNHDIDKDIAKNTWDDMEVFGFYAFNKSHATAYAMIAYWCLYLKAHWPLEFAASTLNHEKDTNRQLDILKELNKEGYKYQPYHPEKSTDKWEIMGNYLIGPLQNIKGIGPKSVQTILGARARGESLPPGIQKKLALGETPIDSLFPIQDMIKQVCPDLEAMDIITLPTPIETIGDAHIEREIMLLGVVDRITVKDENSEEKIAQRGYALEEGAVVKSLNIQFKDDTGTFFCKISRFNYSRLGRQIEQTGNPGKAVYAWKGIVWGNASFKGLMTSDVRFLGIAQ